jgi:uncharacterized protein DUF4399
VNRHQEPTVRPQIVRSTPLAVAALAAIATLAACEKKAATNDSSATAAAAPAATPAPATPAAPAAGVTIVSPKDNDTTGADVTVVLSKEGAVSIEKASSTKVEGVGHYHLFLDTVVVAEGQVIPPTTKHMVHIGTGDSTYTFKGLTPGQHEIVAVIGYGDHSVMAAKRDTVKFVVKK